MSRRAGCFPVLIALLASLAPAGEGPTRFRKRHTLILCAKKGERVETTVACLAASIGYADRATYQVLSPFGRTVAKGVVPPNDKRLVRVDAKVAGPYTLVVDPGMNAFTVEPSVATWAVDIRDGHRLNVIAHARDLYFWVPKGTKAFTLTLNGEPATLTVLDGAGRVAKTRTIPLYTTVEQLVPVPEGTDGAAWRLRLDLKEDQGVAFSENIPPYLAERPITETVLRDLQGGASLARFDLQFTPTGALALPARPKVAKRLETKDGLALGLSASGQVGELQVAGKGLLPADTTPLGGFFLRDHKAGPEVVPVQGRFETWNIGLGQAGTFPGTGVELKASYTASRHGIAIGGTLKDTTGRDRAVTLYFALPVAAAEGLQWWDTIDAVRPVTKGQEFGHYSSARVGANGRSSVYPFGGVGGLALAIPLSHPCIHRIAYNAATQQLYLALDFALTPATAKFPQQARFGFVLTTHDPRWGLRAAAEKYYQLYHNLVAKRMKRDGGWVCWSTLGPIENLADFGVLYHWGPGGASAVAHDDKIGVHSFLYNDSVRFFADLGEFPKRPDAEACTKVFQSYLGAPDPRAFVLSRPAKATGRRRYEGLERKLGKEAASAWLRRCVAAVKTSAAHGADGQFLVGYVINRKDWGPPNWWTGRLFCNPDPDIAGGYGRFLLDEVLGRTFDEYRKGGGELDGVGLDNYFVYSRYPNYRREHFATVDYPLTFSTGDYRPVQVGDFALYEWVERLARKLHGEGKWLMANMGVLPFPFAAHLLDMHGYEWNIERVAAAARTLAYHKQVVTLPVRPAHYAEPWIRKHVRFGIFPGGYGGAKSKFATDPALRALYKRYVPVIHTLVKAGWEPVTHATTDTVGVRLERFGALGALPLHFTADNAADEAAACTVRIDTQALQLGSRRLRAATRLCGTIRSHHHEAGELAISLELPAKHTSVLTLEAP